MSRNPVAQDRGEDPWADWYEAYRRQRDGRAAADAALQEGLQRQIGWMSWFIVIWTAVVCGATVFVIWLLLW
jgi:hypothetical protein